MFRRRQSTRGRVRRRLMVVVVAPLLAIASVLATAPSAAAEWRIEFKIDDALDGWWSELWFDEQTDDALTEARFQQCSANPQVALLRHISGDEWYVYPWQPIFYCKDTDGGWKNWGNRANLPRGWYRLWIPDTRSGFDALDVRFVTVKF